MSSQPDNQFPEADTKKNKTKNSGKIAIIILTILLLSVIAVVLFINVFSADTDKTLQEQLDLAEQYLTELDYEQAVVAYEAAVTIDPQSVDACLGLADAYIALGHYEEALEALERNYDLTKDESIAQKIRNVKALIAKQNGETTDLPDISENDIAEPEPIVLTDADIQNAVSIIYSGEASKVAGQDYVSNATVATLGKVPDASIIYVGMGGYGSPIGMGVHFQGYTVGVQANPISGYKYVECTSDTIQFTGSTYNSHLNQNVPTYTVPESGTHYIYVYYEPIG